MTGERFGRLVVGSLVEKRGNNKIYECRCDCGSVRTVHACNLRAGRTLSCGCYRNERVREATGTHGMRWTRIYAIWTGMKTRCLNPNAKSYQDYGARGITICDRWTDSFEAFFTDMGDIPFPGAQIDRIDNSGPYSKDNCKWSTRTENSRNKRNSSNITLNGETKTVAEWAAELGIKASILYKRIYRGWSADRILTTAPKC